MFELSTKVFNSNTAKQTVILFALKLLIFRNVSITSDIADYRPIPVAVVDVHVGGSSIDVGRSSRPSHRLHNLHASGAPSACCGHLVLASDDHQNAPVAEHKDEDRQA